MDNNEIRQKARDLIHLIQSRFVNRDGLLVRHFPPQRQTLYDNFDDLVPFFLFFQEDSFLRAQVALLRERGENLVSVCATESGVLWAPQTDEWLGGLHCLWKTTKDDNAWFLLRHSVEFVLAKLVNGTRLCSAYFRDTGTTSDCYEPWSSGLLEVFCEARDEFPGAFDVCREVIRSWIDDDYFQKYHLFPYRMFFSPLKRFVQEKVFSRVPVKFPYSMPSPRQQGFLRNLRGDINLLVLNGYYSQLMKSNSTCAFTLLELYRATGDEMYSKSLALWLEAASNAFCEGGKVYMEWYPRTGLRRSPMCAPASILVDVICDCAFSLDSFSPWLSKAKEIIDYHVAGRLRNGLVPAYEGAGYAHMDNQVDFAVSARRYGELAGDDSYLDLSRQILEATLREHYTDEGYTTYSGSQVPERIIDPKYNALLLKGMICLLTGDQPLYPLLTDLFKDR